MNELMVQVCMAWAASWLRLGIAFQEADRVFR